MHGSPPHAIHPQTGMRLNGTAMMTLTPPVLQAEHRYLRLTRRRSHMAGIECCAAAPSILCFWQRFPMPRANKILRTRGWQNSSESR